MAVERSTETYDNFDLMYRRAPYIPLERPALYAFTKYMDKYLVTKTVERPFKAEIRVYDVDRYLFDEGATNSNGEIVVQQFKAGVWKDSILVTPTDCKPITYELAMAKFNQMLRYKSSLQKGKESRFAQYNEMSKQMAQQFTPNQ